MTELWELLSGLEVPDLILCAAAVLILDLFAISVIFAAGRESRLCQKRWEKVGSGVALRFQDVSYPLSADEILLGRHISADIRLADPSVSRYHAVMTVTGGIWSITDLGSKSGTFVNERQVQHAKLIPGDVIRLGSVQLLVTDHAGASVSRKKPQQGKPAPKKTAAPKRAAVKKTQPQRRGGGKRV